MGIIYVLALVCLLLAYNSGVNAKLLATGATFSGHHRSSLVQRLTVGKSWLKLRGGEDANSFEENDVDESDAHDADSTTSSVVSIPGMATVKELWRKTPPITQAYIGGSMAITILSFLFNSNQWPNFLHFSWAKIAMGEVWRIMTAFLYFGQLDLFYPLTMQFVWQHMSQLEKMSYNKPEDFLVMLLFGGSSLIALYSVLSISTKFLGHNLATYMVYIWSRMFEGTDVNFMDLFTLKSELLPWFFCAQTLLLEQDIPWADLIGIFVGHLYHYVKQKGALTAPEVVRGWFQSERMKARYAAFRSEFE